MQLSQNLLFTEETFDYSSILNGTKVKGSYNTMQFVLRLRDDVRDALNKNEVDYETIQAISTNIHENIHWWQHIGSNFGFLFSLAYPALTHITKNNLLNIIAQDLAYKPIIEFDRQYFEKNGKADIEDINLIVNNFYDLEYAKIFAMNNQNIHTIIKDKRFFLSVGHCYRILWSSTIEALSITFDNNYNFLPNPIKWNVSFDSLTQKKAIGFSPDSPTPISPIGIKAIYEGQARFSQLQYLAASFNNELTYIEFEDEGMLDGIYNEAFELFLKITKFDKPTNLLDSKVGLFLLICDLSINPNNGFPLEIYDYENFLLRNDPGIRFLLLCVSIAQNHNKYIESVQLYSKEEYVSLSKDLSESIGCKCSYESIDEVLSWSKFKELSQILKQEQKLEFSKDNLPIRLMFSKYYRFQEDKKKYPNIFCWFGYHSAGKNSKDKFEIANSLFKKHHALFVDDYDGEIKPVIFDGYKEENIRQTFNKFYGNNVLYDLVYKWICEKGEFKFDYKWLANSRADNYTSSFKEGFKKQFKISIDDIKIL